MFFLAQNELHNIQLDHLKGPENTYKNLWNLDKNYSSISHYFCQKNGDDDILYASKDLYI